MSIILNTTISLGDNIQSFRLLSAMLQQLPGPNSIIFTQPDIGSLFPAKKYGAVPIESLPLDSQQRVIRIDIHDYILRRYEGVDSTHDPIASLAQRFGVMVTNEYPEIEIPENEWVPSSYFTLAAQVLNNPQKNMPPEFWQELVNVLHLRYHDPVGHPPFITAMGVSKTPKDSDLARIEGDVSRFKGDDYIKTNLSQYLAGVKYFWDEPLPRVAKLIANTRKCFITVDSGPHHLNSAIRVPEVQLFNDHNVITTRFSKNAEANERREYHRPLTVKDAMERIAAVIA